MNEFSVFAFESSAVRVVMRDGEAWFVAGDIARVLGYRDAEQMTRMLEEDEKGKHIVGTLGGNQEASIVSESGLYACIFKSRRLEAQAFRKWVTSEVLPAIRKTGSYHAPGAAPVLSRDPSHVADLTVAASRTFNALLRSSRAAGISLPKALRQANAGTLRKVGVDMLAEIDAESHVADLEAEPERRLGVAPRDIPPDPLDTAVSEWAATAETAHPYRMRDIITAAIGMDPSHRKYNSTTLTVAKTLRRIGFVNRSIWLDGVVRKVWILN